MSSTPTRHVRGTPQQGTGQQKIDCEGEISSLLGALEDDDCRAILEATSEQARSASELCDCCNLSSSTAYRKIDNLTDAGLLEESIRLSRSGSHTSEYRLAVQNLEISLDGGVELSMTTSEGGHQIATAD